MPLPEGNPEWPPADCRKPNGLYDRWGAWYSGETTELARVYEDLLGTGSILDPKGYAGMGPMGGGLRGFLSRMWWGKPAQPGSLQEAKLHIPLAGDIASTSADLLFGEPPALLIDGDDTTQDRADELMESAHSALIEAAEMVAAYGGGYVRVGWDAEVAEEPLFYAYAPDTAVPEWRSGHLAAVTFWREVGRDGGRIFRHLERHEKGRIFHGLYAGTEDRLGRPLALGDHPETEPYVAVVDQDGGVSTGFDGLAAQYIPNMRPNRTLRGSPLGRSDYSGIEPIMDALDETWTSLMRDFRLGKARLIVPEMYLQNEGRGKGSYFDPEQAIFQAVNALPDAGGTGGLQISQVQFAIRITEHLEGCKALATQALRGAGYNAQTFGETGEVAATATEVVARERRSYTTRARKIRYWKRPLALLFEAALAIDALQFKSGAKPIRPMIEWPDGVAIDPQAQAQTLQLLHAAESVSTRTRVEMLHPDWDDDAIEDEVKEIQEDKKADLPPVPLPGAGPAGTSTRPGAPGAPGGAPAAKTTPAKAGPAKKAAPPVRR